MILFHVHSAKEFSTILEAIQPLAMCSFSWRIFVYRLACSASTLLLTKAGCCQPVGEYTFFPNNQGLPGDHRAVCGLV